VRLKQPGDPRIAAFDPQIEYGALPDEVERAVLDVLARWVWLIPTWCHTVNVGLNARPRTGSSKTAGVRRSRLRRRT
jgi:hypothetical protein